MLVDDWVPRLCEDYNKWSIDEMAEWVYNVTNVESIREIMKYEEMDGKTMHDFLDWQYQADLGISKGPWYLLSEAARAMIANRPRR